MVDINSLLSEEAESLLTHQCQTFPASNLHLPGPDYVDRVVAHKNRKPAVLRNLNSIYISRIVANSGPVLKRYKAAAFGRAVMIKKRTSHIELELNAKP